MSSERHVHLDRRAVLLVVGCTVLWGLGQIASKVALAQIPPLTQGGLRSVGAALLVLTWARWRGIPLWERDGTLVPGLIAGTLFAAEFGAIYSALQFTTAGRMTSSSISRRSSWRSGWSSSPGPRACAGSRSPGS